MIVTNIEYQNSSKFFFAWLINNKYPKYKAARISLISVELLEKTDEIGSLFN